MGILRWIKNNFNSEEDIIKDKGEYFEALRIKESIFNFEIERIRIPKSNDKLLEGNVKKVIEVQQ